MTWAQLLADLDQRRTPLSEAERVRYARHLTTAHLGEVGQGRLRAARVTVVGAGGLGSPVLTYLTAAGVGHLTVLDDDVVEVHNLQRQVLHGHADVGRPKVESAAHRLAALDASTQLTTHQVRVVPDNARGLLADADVVVDATDNAAARFTLADACHESGQPLVHGAVTAWIGQVTTLWRDPGEGHPAASLRDLFPEQPDVRADGSVLGMLPGAVGSWMAAEVVKVLTGAGEPLFGRLLLVDLLKSTTTTIPWGSR